LRPARPSSSYVDNASGVLEKNAAGKMSMSRITLRPAIFCGFVAVSVDLDALHHAAHEECFIANSRSRDRRGAGAAMGS
jgi:organic hydroperoxide reductase OsmC/OhrA